MDIENTIPSVAVVTPVYRAALEPEEVVSMRHLEAVLGSYDRFLITPRSLEFERPGFQVRAFEDDDFESVHSYSKLLLTPRFYEAFASYEYILIYQLDCLVFSDQLADWCGAGFDYLGAPWLADPTQPERGFSRVGNGGLSLRRVQACLSVLRGGGEERSAWSTLLRSRLPDRPSFDWLGRLRVLREARRGVTWYRTHYSLNEDHFWADRAQLFDPSFVVAPVSHGLRFSFECAPRYCLRKTDGVLPFGCHAWAKWDREFWEPYLI